MRPLILAEAGILGAGGALVGVPLGYLVALRNLDTVSGTLTSIYVLEGISGLALEPATVFLSVAVGVLGAMAGAAWPAMDMARRNTVALLSPVTLHEQASRAAGRLSQLALVLAAAATVDVIVVSSGIFQLNRIAYRLFDDLEES